MNRILTAGQVQVKYFGCSFLFSTDGAPRQKEEKRKTIERICGCSEGEHAKTWFDRGG